jgi:AcrR family transcriptional regulator
MERTETESRYARRRREIIDAAAAVFKRRGYRGTTFSHIAEELGTDRASMYYYVTGKEEIFEELVSKVVRLNLAEAIAIRDGAGTAPEKLRRVIEGLMNSYGEYYPSIYVLIQENLAHVDPERSGWAEQIKKINRTYEGVVIEIIDAGKSDGTLTEGAPSWLLAYGIIGMVGWTNRWFSPDGPYEAAEVGRTFAATLMDGLARP